MKRNCAKRKTRGSSKPGKTIKTVVYEFDDDYIPSSPKRNMAMKSNPRTRSQAATIRKCPIRIPDTALKPQKGTNTKRATSNPPKMTSARRIVEPNDGVSTNRGKQSAEEFSYENAPHENQDLHPSTDSSSRYPTTLGPLESLAAGEDAELQQPRKSTIPSSTELVQNVFPSTVAKEKNEAIEARSFRLTEMAAKMVHGPSDDDEEAESSVDQTLISVGGYRVKKEIAPLLEQIMDKHKDIAKECRVKNPKSHVPYLEVICSVCQKLENTSLKDVTDTELEDLLIVVEGIQYMGFDVKWLSERLKDISKVKRLLKDYPSVKEEEAKLDMQLKEIDMLKQQLSAAEANFSAKKMEVDKVNRDSNLEITDLKAKGLAFWDKSLLYGLIIST